MDQKDKLPNVLIVGTQPYNKMVQSRAFDSYFHFWQKENLAQIFSDPRMPVKGQCETLYQITDRRLIDARFDKGDPGKPLYYNELLDFWTPNDSKKKAPKRKTALLKLLRKMVWKRKYWATPQLDKWLEEFKPDIVFISFSYDFFIFDLAFYVADKFNIPIIASSTDDYIFNGHFSLNPFYWVYRSLYKKTIKKLLKRNAFWTFESQKIQDRYTKEFDIDSQIQYIATEIPNDMRPKSAKKIENIRYFGNLEYGRFDSICDIAKALRELKPGLKIDVYSKDTSEIGKRKLRANPNIEIHDQIPYEEVLKLSNSTDLLLIVEGFKKGDVRDVRYSLSTKVADSLKTGNLVLGYGHKDTGAIDFLSQFKCSITATSHNELKEVLSKLLSDPIQYSKTVETAIEIIRNNFDVNKEAKKFAELAVMIEANKSKYMKKG